MDKVSHCDIAIVGCGPAGMSAAVNAKIRGKCFRLHGVDFCTPKLNKSPHIDNYLGFPNITGPDLRHAFFDHAKRMGVEVLPGKISGIMPSGDGFILATAKDTFEARAIILATGVSATAYLPGEKEFLGRGVSYCATCDGALFRGKVVAVIGKGEEAKGEALFLSGLCREVWWLGPPDQAPTAANVRVSDGRPTSIAGDDRARRIETTKGPLEVDGVFVLWEVTPAEQLVPGLEMRDGAIVVNRNLETNIPGVFAAGDCTGRPYQLAKAVGEGQVAALSAVGRLDQGSPAAG